MNGPSDEFRESIYRQLATIPNHNPITGERVVTPEVEGALTQVMELILGSVVQDVEQSEVLRRDTLQAGSESVSEAQFLLVVVDQWSSLVSYAASWVYAPASPSPRRMAGWGLQSISYIRMIANLLFTPLNAAAFALGANSYSINVGFPWGISVGLNWPIDPGWTPVGHAADTAVNTDDANLPDPKLDDSEEPGSIASQRQKALSDRRPPDRRIHIPPR